MVFHNYLLIGRRVNIGYNLTHIEIGGLSHKKLVIGTVITNVDTTANTVNVLVYALNAKTGLLAWTQNLGSGTVPSSFLLNRLYNDA